MTTGQEVAPAPSEIEIAEEERVEREPPLLRGPRLARVTVIASLLVLGAAGAIVGVLDRTRDEGFILNVTNPSSVSAVDVTRIVGTAPEPVLPAQRTAVVSTRCTPGAPAGLRNPWQCQVRWHDGRTAHYEVHISTDGSFVGYGRPPIHGCCIRVPRFE